MGCYGPSGIHSSVGQGHTVQEPTQALPGRLAVAAVLLAGALLAVVVY
jgi:hypothetical protein